MYHYLDHFVATVIIFVMLTLLERIIYREEPENTMVELFLVAAGSTISIPFTIAAITITYMILVLLKQPNALTRASYWPVEVIRLITRHRSYKQSL